MKKPKSLRKLSKAKRYYIRQSGVCPLCGKSLCKEFSEFVEWIFCHLNHIKTQKRRKSININYDHIVPISKGGKDGNSNKQLTHAECNSLKGNNLKSY